MTKPSEPVSATQADVPHPRVVRSFVRRAGRVTSGQAKAYEAWGGQYLLPFAQQPLDAAQAFGREYYRLVHGSLGADRDAAGRETDLFSGVGQ